MWVFLGVSLFRGGDLWDFFAEEGGSPSKQEWLPRRGEDHRARHPDYPRRLPLSSRFAS